MSVLETDLTGFLQTSGIGTVGSDLFVGFKPSPAKCVSVVAYGGSPSIKTMGPTIVFRFPRLQVIARDDDKAAAGEKAEAIRDALDGKSFSGSAGDWQLLQTLSEVQYIGVDDNNRHRYAVSVEATIAP